MRRKITLICQDLAKNHDKYYTMMEHDDENAFTVSYGRIGKTMNKHQYHISKWRSIYNSKIKKGYVDISTLPLVEGSPVVSPDGKLCVITGISYNENHPHIVQITSERGRVTTAHIDEISPGYLKPGTFTHDSFYPNLIKLQKSILDSNGMTLEDLKCKSVGQG